MSEEIVLGPAYQWPSEEALTALAEAIMLSPSPSGPTTPLNAERATPQWLFDRLNQEFRFTLDACASPENTKCERWFGTQTDGTFIDGLTTPWLTETVFVNPPYSRGQLRRWLEKAHQERASGATVVLLIPGDRSTRCWQRLVHGEEIRDLKKRVSFVGAGAKFPSAVVVMRPVDPDLPWFVTPAAPKAEVKRVRRSPRPRRVTPDAPEAQDEAVVREDLGS